MQSFGVGGASGVGYNGAFSGATVIMKRTPKFVPFFCRKKRAKNEEKRKREKTGGGKRERKKGKRMGKKGKRCECWTKFSQYELKFLTFSQCG
jgi:hypothetical protein